MNYPCRLQDITMFGPGVVITEWCCNYHTTKLYCHDCTYSIIAHNRQRNILDDHLISPGPCACVKRPLQPFTIYVGSYTLFLLLQLRNQTI